MDPTSQSPGSSDEYFDINKFEQLLARLEASKRGQQGQAAEASYAPNM